MPKTKEKPLIFTSEGMGYICRRCGCSNPSHGATKCGNCDENLHEEIGANETLTEFELITWRAAIHIRCRLKQNETRG